MGCCSFQKLIMKLTCLKYSKDTEHLLPVNNKTEFKRGCRALHTAAVKDVIGNLTNNRILATRPPDINDEELLLIRKERSLLAQLWSGFSRKVNSYLHRIDDSISNICPDCNATPHDVPHLFNCPANPTQLTMRDLWRKPRECSRFLKLNDETLTMTPTGLS